MITHDANGGHSDLWSYIEGLREDLCRAEERIRDAERNFDALLAAAPPEQWTRYKANLALAERADAARADALHGGGS